jgi:hypothetical protein
MLVHFSPSSNERCTFLFHVLYRLFFTSLFQVTGIFFPLHFYNGHKFFLLVTSAKRVIASDGSQNHGWTLFTWLLKRVVKFPEADVHIVLVLRMWTLLFQHNTQPASKVQVLGMGWSQCSLYVMCKPQVQGIRYQSYSCTLSEFQWLRGDTIQKASLQI